MVSSFPHRRSCAAFPARSGPPVSHNRLILSLFPALGKGFFPIGPAAFWAEQEISSRRLAFSPAILYNDWDFKGNARDHAADHQRARPRLKARKAGSPARGPAANPRRGAPVTGRCKPGALCRAKQGGTAKHPFVPAKDGGFFTQALQLVPRDAPAPGHSIITRRQAAPGRARRRADGRVGIR